MKIFRYTFIFITSIIVFVACSNNTKMENEPEIVLNMDFPEKDNPIKLSELVDSISFIKLQTNDSCRIGAVDKLIVTDKNYIVVDKSLASTIFIFDKNGQFMNRIGNMGHSQKEYINIEDVAIGDDNIFVLDSKGNKIVCYAIDGKYIEYYPFDLTAYYFKHIKEKIFAFSCEYTKNYGLINNDMLPNFILYDFGKKEIINTDRFFNSNISDDAYTISLNNLNPYMYNTFSNDIYRVSEEGLRPFLRINYPEEYTENMNEYANKVSNKNITASDIEKIQKEKPFPRLISFFDCDNMCFAFIVNAGRLYYNFYYPNENKLLQAVNSKGIPLEDDIYNGLVVIPQAVFNGNLYYAENIENLSSMERFKESSSEDNPVIVKLYIKQKDRQ